MRLFVKCLAFPGYKILGLNMGVEMKVDDLKSVISNEKNIPKELQRLTFRGTILQDSNILFVYKLVEGTTLHMSLRFKDELQININCPNGSTITVDTNTSATVKSLIPSIIPHDKNPLSLGPKGWNLFFNGRLLRDTNKISEYEEITDGSTLYLDQSCDFSFTPIYNYSSNDFSSDSSSASFYVKYMKYRIITFNYKIDDTILDIKNKIQEKENVPTFLQCLSFEGTQLDCDESSIISYAIKPGSTLLLELKPKTIQIQCEVWLQNVKTNETLWLQVGLNDKISDFKCRIQEMKGFAPRKQRLLLNNTLLRGDRTFLDCGVGPGTTLELFLERSREIPVFIKTMGGTTYPLEINPSERVAEMLEKLYFIEEIPLVRQCLSYDNEMLDRLRTFGSYNIEGGSTLLLFDGLL